MSASRHGCPWEAAEVLEMRRLAGQGFTRIEAARMLTRTTVSVAAKSFEEGVRWPTSRRLPPPDGSARAILHYGPDGTAEAFAAHLDKRGLAGTARHYGLARNTIKNMKKTAAALQAYNLKDL